MSAFHAQPSTVDPADVVDGVLGGLVQQAAAEPWLGALFALLLLNAVGRRIPGLLHGRSVRDPQRCFMRADKRLLLERAGHRSEHHSSRRRPGRQGRPPSRDIARTSLSSAEPV